MEYTFIGETDCTLPGGYTGKQLVYINKKGERKIVIIAPVVEYKVIKTLYLDEEGKEIVH